MYGAILGDIIGSPYEFDRGDKTKEFTFFEKGAAFTDDSVMTIAVADALVETLGQSDDDIRDALVYSMRLWGRKYRTQAMASYEIGRASCRERG